MTIDRDPLGAALRLLEARPLDPRFAAKVGAHARAELGKRPTPRTTSQLASVHDARTPSAIDRARSTLRPRRLRVALRAGLVPAVLSLAAVVETAVTARTVAQIYGTPSIAASK